MYLSDSVTAVMQAHLSSMIYILYYSPNVSNSSYCILTQCNWPKKTILIFSVPYFLK